MTYIYTQANRLEDPHSYMYTSFEGDSLLQSYQLDRLSTLRMIREANYCGEAFDIHAVKFLEKSFDRISQVAGEKFRQLSLYDNTEISFEKDKDDGFDTCVIRLAKFRATDSISTFELLQALIATQLTGRDDSHAKEWIDRLVQRFEVTKKIYDIYPAGFRKGDGSNSSVQLYWLFALSLSLYYADSQQIKYLSTLLKICDLLCSLPEDSCCGHMSSGTMIAILATEIVGVQLLAEKKGV